MARSPFINPAPSGTLERVDQGQDWGNITGPIKAVASGVISNVYPSLSGFGYTIIEKLRSAVGGNQYVYYGLESGGAPIGVAPGESVVQGEAVAKGIDTGGIEIGFWNPATGRAVGAPDFTGSNPTPAGALFRRSFMGSTQPSAATTTTGAGKSSSLAQLWIQAGGSPALANTMAAIAEAESSGQVGAQNSQSGAAGLWQILPSAHPQYNVQKLLSDPLYNAQAAVAVEKSQGLGAWSTYTSGAYLQFLSGASGATYGGTRPGGGTAGGGGSSGSSDDATPLVTTFTALENTPRDAPQDVSLGGDLSSAWNWYIKPFEQLWGEVKSAEQAPGKVIHDVTDFEDMLARIFSPRNFLRAAELGVGLGLMAYGARVSIEGAGGGGGSRGSGNITITRAVRDVALGGMAKEASNIRQEQTTAREIARQEHSTSREGIRQSGMTNRSEHVTVREKSRQAGLTRRAKIRATPNT